MLESRVNVCWKAVGAQVIIFLEVTVIEGIMVGCRVGLR